MPFALGGVPILHVALSAGGRTAHVMAVVDSGSARSMFPLEIAEDLGVAIKEDTLNVSGIEGRAFRTWSAVETIMGEIVRIVPDTGEEESWGSSFAMTPAFSEMDSFLLGRQDFFAAHTIHFLPGNPHASFVIDS